MTNHDTKGRKSPYALSTLVLKGTELAGATAANFVTFFANDASSAAVLSLGGSAAAVALTRIGEEVSQRFLAPREEIRIGAVVSFAAEQIRNNLNAGQALRDDGFFSDSAGHRSAFEEIAEGVVHSAQREHEEKKVRHLGALLANLAFRGDIDKAQANFLVQQLDRLSYRQLCILSLVGIGDSDTDDVVSRLARGVNQPLCSTHYHVSNTISAYHEMMGLSSLRLISELVMTCDSERVIIKPAITPRRIHLVAFGEIMFELAALDKIDQSDLAELRAILITPSAQH